MIAAISALAVAGLIVTVVKEARAIRRRTDREFRVPAVYGVLACLILASPAAAQVDSALVVVVDSLDIDVTPDRITGRAGTTQQFTATVTNSLGEVVDTAVVWYTDTPDRVAVDPVTGMATLRRSGAAYVYAAVRTGGGGGGPSPIPPAPGDSRLFFDDFSSGDLSHTENGVRWTSTRGDGFNCNGIEVRDGALAFDYRGSASSNAFCQQDWTFGAEYAHIWIELWIRWPENYANRTISGTSANDKLLLITDDPAYESQAYHVKSLAEIWPGGIMRPMYGTSPNRDGVPMSEHEMRRVSGAIEDSDLGEWVRYRFEFGVADPGRSNGVWRAWKGDELIIDYSSLPNRATDGLGHGYRYSYLFGAHNAGYLEDTTFLLDNVSVYVSDPGWLR